MVFWPMKKLLNRLCLKSWWHLHISRAQIWNNYLNEDLTNTLPCWNGLYGTSNLVMQSLSSMPMVFKLEDLFQSLYKYFSSSPKHHLEFTKLVECMEIKGLKVLWNVKTRCISMLAPLKRVGKEYKTLIVKMATNSGTMEATKANLVNMCDVGTILNLPCVLFMLESVNAWMKFV